MVGGKIRTKYVGWGQAPSDIFWVMSRWNLFGDGIYINSETHYNIFSTT